MPSNAAAIASQGIEDPYAPIRRLRVNRQTGRQQLIERGDGGSSVPDYEQLPDQLMLADDTIANMGQFQSKYNGLTELPDGRIQMTVQRPGMHKYDTQELIYKVDPATGEYVLDDSVAPVDSRQTSSNNRIRDSLEHGIGFVGTGLAAAYGASALAGLGGTGAGAATGAGGTTIGTGETIAMMAANGMTDAQIAAALAASGNTAGAGMLTAGLGAGELAGVTAGGIKTMGTLPEVASQGSPLLTNAQAGINPAVSTPLPGPTPLPPVIPPVTLPTTPSGPAPVTTPGPAVTPPPATSWFPGTMGDWVALAGLVGGGALTKQAQDDATAAAKKAADDAAATRAFTERQYNDNLPFVRQSQQKSVEVADALLRTMAQQDALAKEYADYNRTTFRPLEQGIVKSAQEYDTPEKRQAAAGTALADVDMRFAAQNQAAARQMAANGVNPGSARSMAVMGSQGVEQARAGAGAAAQARKGVETVGFARQMDAASLGRNLPSNQATAASLGINAGNSAVNANKNAADAAIPTNSLALQGFNAANRLNLEASNLQQRATDSSNQLWGQLGTTAGRFITSDVNMKQDIEPADDDEALEQVTSTPVSNFRYNPAKMAQAGIPMDRPAEEVQTGAMAQDVNATMGDKAAPGGKKINVATLLGKAMLSIQALDKKVDALTQQVGGKGAYA